METFSGKNIIEGFNNYIFIGGFLPLNDETLSQVKYMIEHEIMFSTIYFSVNESGDKLPVGVNTNIITSALIKLHERYKEKDHTFINKLYHTEFPSYVFNPLEKIVIL